MKDKKSMPVSGTYSYGKATGKSEGTSKIKYGEDLRNGGGKKK